MPDNMTFNTPNGQTIATEARIAFLNVGAAESPTWAPVGIRVSSSDASYDWGKETSQDILGNTYTTLKKPVVTQGFDPWPMTNGDEALQRFWNDGIRNQDAAAMGAKDMLIVHKYAGTKETAVFAERYTACAVEITSMAGDGGGHLNMAVTVTYGGERTVGTVTVEGNKVTFTADSAL